LVLDRTWQAGDRVRLRLPMQFRWIKGRKLQAGRVALSRGPVLFCLNPARNEELAGTDFKEVTLDPASVEGPTDDDTIRPGGQACCVRAWSSDQRSLGAPTDRMLVLTEFADPGGEATHLRVPAPDAAMTIDDELMQPTT
jgi:hypothetical protein